MSYKQTFRQYRQAIQASETLKALAAEELKNAIEEQIAELNALGFEYKLFLNAGKEKLESAAVETLPEKKRAKKRRKITAIKHCKICDIPGHDIRSHRHHHPQKKFTVKELAERGLPNG